MKTYKEQSEGVIQWREVNGEATTTGLIIEGRIRTRTNEDGETETYSPWDELLDSGEAIEWITDEQKAAEAAEAARQALKSQRDQALAGLSYTFDDGRTLQTRPQDAQNLQTAIALDEPVEFVCADNTVAVFTVAELQEALGAGIAQAKAVWADYTEGLKAL